MNTTNLKGYLISTLVTFVAVFATVFFTATQIPGFTFSKTSLGALAVSAVISAVRAISKLIVEYFAGVTTNPIPAPVSNVQAAQTPVI